MSDRACVTRFPLGPQKEGIMAIDTRSSQVTLALNEEEREQLLILLESALRDKLVEVHRTETLSARTVVQQQADILEKLVNRLRQP